MKCLYCDENTKVIDSRDNESFTRRRRECLVCSKRFTTYERADIYFNILKKSGDKQPFDREKIKMGMIKACEKRPITIEQIDEAVNNIEMELRRLNKKTIKSEIIGKKISSKLKKLDKVAYIRFASVYKEFKDIDAFKEEIKLLS